MNLTTPRVSRLLLGTGNVVETCKWRPSVVVAGWLLYTVSPINLLFAYLHCSEIFYVTWREAELAPASPPSPGLDNNRYRINKLFCWSTTNLSATWYLIQTFLFRNFVVILVSTNPATATTHSQRCQWMVIFNILLLTSELWDHLHS